MRIYRGKLCTTFREFKCGVGHKPRSIVKVLKLDVKLLQKQKEGHIQYLYGIMG